jgi:CSLREA domain-containing protein
MHCKPYLSVRPRSLRSLALLLTALSPCLFPAQRAAAQAAPVKTFYVNSTVDGTDAQPGDGICTTGQTTPGGAPQCTLRAAIDEANSDSGANTPYAVFVPAGTYFLTVSEACRVNGFASNGIPLCVSGNVQILGAAQSTVMLDSGQQDSVMIVTSTATACLSHLTIQHGKNMYIGGGILDNGSLTVQNVTFNSNTYDDGSAIQNIDGSLLTIVGCTFTNNAGTVIQFHGGGTDSVSIDTSYFANNTASNAAVFEVLGTNNNAPGPLIISNSTIVNNTASADYLIYAGALTMTNTTVTGNTIGNSTLISAATTIFNNVTISNNTGKPYVDTSGLTLSNSIIDSGNGQPDLCGPLTDLGHNIIGNLGCSTGSVSSTTQIGVDPMLSMLEIDGGSVPTMTPLTGSPALAGGSTASPGGNASGACTALDENGSPRGVSAICSIGAAEPLRGLQLNHITPTVGGAGGNITMVLTGSGFDPATTVALHRSGQTDLAPQAALVSQDATAISAGFSLTGVALGSYDVVITTSTGSITLPASFNVAAPTSNVVQSYLSGPSRIRPGRPPLP